MGLLAFGIIFPPATRYIGQDIYDFYILSLLDGRFDLPLRILRGEGHYTPDGTGYLYHGLGPVLTRLPFAAFVEFPTPWLAQLSIWFWAVIGNVCYHRAFEGALERAPFDDGNVPDIYRILLALLVWFGSPGVLLVANTSFFIEPISMAYALGGGFVLLLTKTAFGQIPLVRALIPLSLLAGLSVHARPPLAVGLYAGTCILAAVALFRGYPGGRKHAAAAMLVLALFGGLLVTVNAMRFNNPTAMHGSFGKSDLQYGLVFWGIESENSERAQAFKEYGQFNVRRILPNGAMYVGAIPAGGAAEGFRQNIEAAFIALKPWIGFIRLEAPNVGMVFLWPLWTLLMLIGLRQRLLWQAPGISGMFAFASTSLLMFSYATVTLRYHVDIWPAIAFPAIFGIGPLVAGMARPGARFHWRPPVVLAMMAAGILITSLTIGRSRNILQDNTQFTREDCLKLTTRRGFDEARREDLCRLPA